MRLFEFNDRFIISSDCLDDANLEIDRFSGKLKLTTAQPVSVDTGKQIDGLIGFLQLATCPCLIVITSSRSVGTLNGEEIRKVTGTEVIPYRTTDRHANQIFVEMLEAVLKCEAFYYSRRMDISRSLQWLSENATPGFDENFVWNARLLAPFKPTEFSSFAIPLIHGFVGIRDCVVNNKRFKLALISRRSVQRAGVRFHTRGLDQNGNCANFVETEQIVEFEATNEAQIQQRYLSSFVQIRASIPLFWVQRTNLKWQPDPSLLSPLSEQGEAYRAHINALFTRYGRDALSGIPRKIVIVNLINQYGREDILGTVFRSVVQSVNFDNVRFESFDFHRHCSSLNWDRLSMLRQKLEPEVRNFGFFLTKLERQNGNSSADFVENAGVNRNYQNGLFRTNCMDCLDRTNVVQALLAMESLRFQLQKIGILSHNDNDFDAWPTFVYIFKNLWADNGDAVSNQYAGTAALKTDYTRIGRRTFGGALQDGHNSLVRYFKNNFSDGYRQDAINLFLGNYVVDRHNLPTRLDHSPVNFDSNGFAFLSLVFSFAMAVLCLLMFDNSFFTFFWFLLSAVVFAYIWVNGEDFADRPRLVVTAN